MTLVDQLPPVPQPSLESCWLRHTFDEPNRSPTSPTLVALEVAASDTGIPRAEWGAVTRRSSPKSPSLDAALRTEAARADIGGMTVPMAGPGPGMWTSTIPALNLTTFENIFFKGTTWASYARQSHRSIGSRTGFSGLAGWACSCRRPQRRDPQLDCAMTSLTTSQRI